MAPELVDSQSIGYNEKVDIWSIGITTFMLVTGLIPFNDRSQHAIKKKIIEAKVPWKDQISKAISKNGKDFINKCLVKDYVKRWSAA